MKIPIDIPNVIIHPKGRHSHVSRLCHDTNVLSTPLNIILVTFNSQMCMNELEITTTVVHLLICESLHHTKSVTNIGYPSTNPSLKHENVATKMVDYPLAR